MKKLKVWLPLLFAIVLIAGMLVGSELRKNIPSSRKIFAADKSTSLEEVVHFINTEYVDKVSADTLTYEAIQALLTRLDPHSVYIPASHLEEINDDLKGKFEGIGTEFFIIDDTVNITNVLSDGPSDKAGLQAGDKFLKVGDSVVTGKTISVELIKRLLRGAGGSKVTVTLLRNDRTIQATITRGTIPLYSVDASYMIDTATGYIHLNKFSSTTYEEFMKAMEMLQGKGMKKLIFDLRDNGGGILNEAVDIVDEFLNDDKLIVYTQGAKQKKIEYRCKRPGLFETGDLVLLVDETSASASEVVAGALQDWDRATIIGRRTFGKGLVQEQYDLSDGSALRLTVARYYTPIDRNIQKPYSAGRDVYNGEVAGRYQNGELVKGDTSANHTGPVFETKIKHRKVYGGGGITPDIFIPLDTTTLSANLYTLFDNQLFSKFIYNYYRQNLSFFKQFKNPGDFAQRFTQTDAAWNSLLQYAAKYYAINPGPVTAHDKMEIEQRIKTWLARQIWRMEGYYEVNNIYDPMVSRGREILK